MTSIQTVQPMRPREYTGTQLGLVRRTVAQDTTDDEFSMFIEVCKRVGLDPFRKQIYCLVYNKNKPDKRKCVFITGIDGFRACAARNGDYRPDPDPPRFEYDEALKDADTNPLGIVSATVAPMKQDASGEWYPVASTVYWEEFAPLVELWEPDESGRRQPTGRFSLDRTSNWRKMGRVMIAKCAEAQALRKGWPEDLSGVHSPEEMDQAHAAEVSAAEMVKQAEEDARLAKVNASHAVPMIWEYNGAIEFTPEGMFHDRVMEWLPGKDPAEVDWFLNINRIGLQQFWAIDKGAALDLKKHIEAAKARKIEAPTDAG